MKLKQIVLDIVNNPTSRNKIALDIETGEQNVAVHMRKNEPNGRLTKMDALQAISKESKLPVDQLLENELVGAQT